MPSLVSLPAVARTVAFVLLATLVSACAGQPGRAVSAVPPLPTLTLALGGDVMLGRWRDGATELAADPTAPFGPAASVLAAADVSIINLETAFCDQPPGEPDSIALIAPSSGAPALGEAGVDVVSVANNHALDCGRSGLSDAVEALEREGVQVAGLRNREETGLPVVTVTASEAGARVLVLAASLLPPGGPASGEGPGPVWLTAEEARRSLPEAVRALRVEAADAVIVVSLHWGAELAPGPSRRQRALAGALVEAGADVVFGHGAHVLQPIEVVEDAVIAYSLGNLVSDMRGPRVSEAAVVTVAMHRDGGRWRAARLAWAPFVNGDAGLRAPASRAEIPWSAELAGASQLRWRDGEQALVAPLP